MRIGFIVGKDEWATDSVPITGILKEVPLKYMVKKFLTERDNCFTSDIGKLSKKKEYLQIDVALPYYMRNKYPDVEIDIIKPDWSSNNDKTISLKRLMKNDINYILGVDLVNFFLEDLDKNDLSRFKRIREIFKNPKSNVVPSFKQQDFVYNKGKYLKVLEKNGIPINDTIIVDKKGTKNVHSKKFISSLMNKIVKKGWRYIIIKPYMSGWSRGVRKFDVKDLLCDPEILKKYFIDTYDFPGFLIQEVNKGFAEMWEYKLIYLNGKYKYHIGIKAPAGGGCEKEQQTKRISPKLLKKLQSYSDKIVKLVPSITRDGKKIPPVFLRLDFGCCKGNILSEDRYFLNEIENIAANWYVENNPYPVLKEFSKGLYDYAKIYTKK